MLLGLLFLKGKDEQDECSQCDKIQPNTLKTIIWVWQKHLVFVYKKPFFFFFFFFKLLNGDSGNEGDCFATPIAFVMQTWFSAFGLVC